jgi:hypothetical protein
MALTLRPNVDPTVRPDVDPALRRGVDPAGRRADDYLVEGEEEFVRPSSGSRIVNALQILLILMLAVLSFAIFWVVGLLFNFF